MDLNAETVSLPCFRDLKEAMAGLGDGRAEFRVALGQAAREPERGLHGPGGRTTSWGWRGSAESDFLVVQPVRAEEAPMVRSFVARVQGVDRLLPAQREVSRFFPLRDRGGASDGGMLSVPTAGRVPNGDRGQGGGAVPGGCGGSFRFNARYPAHLRAVGATGGGETAERPPPGSDLDRAWMARALEMARAGEVRGEVPVGAVIVRNGVLLAESHNRTVEKRDPTAHAESLAIRAGARRLGDWRLSGCTLYTTLEPCAQCAGAIVLARISRLVFGAHDPKGGMAGSLENLVQDARLNHRVELLGGVLAEESSRLLRGFFQARRGG